MQAKITDSLIYQGFNQDCTQTCKSIADDQAAEEDKSSDDREKTIEHLRCIAKGMAAYLSFNVDEQAKFQTYESVLSIGEDVPKIIKREKEVAKKLTEFSNETKLDFEDPLEAEDHWIRGNRALEGHGEPINLSKAFRYYNSAANSGFAQAHGNLGKLYMEGLGVKEDRQLGLKYYEEGEKMGDPNSLYFMGESAEDDAVIKGKSDSKASLLKAINYYKLAASYGHSGAKIKLASFIENGIYVDRDGKTSIEYFQEAAKLDYGLALNYLGMHNYNQGEYQAALDKFEHAKKLNCVNSLDNLGHCYENGSGVIKDKDTAMEYYKEAAKKRFLVSMLNLARVLKSMGKYKESSMWYRQTLAENPKATFAYIGLGDLYLNGLGVEKNSELAIKNFSKAGEYGDGDGYKRCGDIFFTSNRLNKDNMERAIKYYRKGSKLKCVEAMMILGEIYERGNEHIEQDLGNAIKYYERAYNHGYPYGGISEAKLLLERKSKLDKEKAEKIINEIINRYPNDENIRLEIESKGISTLLAEYSE